jgi:hypothetical protein
MNEVAEESKVGNTMRCGAVRLADEKERESEDRMMDGARERGKE